jgi:transposase-like protein
VAIVWACALSVDEYVGAGKAVAVPRPDCPECSTAMVFWSGYKRAVRGDGLARTLWVRRARCRGCGASHALVPSFCLLGRLDAVEVIGAAIAAVVFRGRGVRPVAAEAGVPHTTARDWVRRFCRRAEMLGAAFAALVVEVAGSAPPAPTTGTGAARALAVMRAAVAAVGPRAGPALGPPWRVVALVTGGKLLAANTDPLSIFLGCRRLIPPVP